MSGKCYGAWWDVIAYELDTNKTIGNEVIKIVDFLSEADAKDQLQVHPIGSTNMCYEQTGNYITPSPLSPTFNFVISTSLRCTFVSNSTRNFKVVRGLGVELYC